MFGAAIVLLVCQASRFQESGVLQEQLGRMEVTSAVTSDFTKLNKDFPAIAVLLLLGTYDFRTLFSRCSGSLVDLCWWLIVGRVPLCLFGCPVFFFCSFYGQENMSIEREVQARIMTAESIENFILPANQDLELVSRGSSSHTSFLVGGNPDPGARENAWLKWWANWTRWT